MIWFIAEAQNVQKKMAKNFYPFCFDDQAFRKIDVNHLN